MEQRYVERYNSIQINLAFESAKEETNADEIDRLTKQMNSLECTIDRVRKDIQEYLKSE
jgi:hypothetical protein